MKEQRHEVIVNGNITVENISKNVLDILVKTLIKESTVCIQKASKNYSYKIENVVKKDNKTNL